MKTETGVSYHVERIRKRSCYLDTALTLLYVLRGKVDVQEEDQTVTLEKGGFLLVVPGTAYEIIPSGESLVGKCVWPISTLAHLLKEKQIHLYCNSAVGYSRWHSDLRKMLDHLTADYAAADHQTEAHIEGHLYRILDMLIEHYQSKGDCISDADAENDTYVARTMQYILKNLHGDISLKALADSMYVSASTLSRAFKKRTGYYFADYVQQLRIKEAMTLLSESDESITKIALHVGFSGSSSFSRTFKKITDETPIGYRERMKREKGQKEENETCEEMRIREELYERGQAGEDGKIHRLVSVDLAHSNMRPLKKIWQGAINIGCIHDLTKANVQKHCLYLCDHLHFQYVRIWNVFSKSLMLTDGCTHGRYNYSLLDQALDFLVENRLKPYLDFGRRPSMAMNPDGEFIYYKEEYTPFASKELWEEAFQNVLRHITRKYGKSEVSTWIFELSRDSCHGEEGERCYENAAFDFFDAWNSAYRCIRSEIPGALFVGVSAIICADSDFLNLFYKKCVQNRCVPDFCSFMIFPYTPDYLWEEGRPYKTREREHSVQIQLDIIKQSMATGGVSSSKLFISEWNNTIANRDYLNDSVFRAAFFASQIPRICDRVDLLCVMGGTDWVSSYLDSGAIVHGGIGLLTKDNIRKPAYFVMEFLNRLGVHVIAADEGYILTRSVSGNYYLLCTNFVPFAPGSCPVREKDRPDMDVLRFEGYPAHVLRFRLSGIARQGYYCIKRRTISSKAGSILDEWENFQFSEDLTGDDVRYLREKCIPEIGMHRQYIGVEEELSFDVEMRPEDVVLIHVFKDDPV